MGAFLGKIRSRFREDSCRQCVATMQPVSPFRLYVMPMSYGHYSFKKEADYYLRNLTPIQSEEEIPVGLYACRIRQYRCPKCGREVTAVRVFYKSQNKIHHEKTHHYKHGELDDLFIETVGCCKDKKPVIS